MADLGLDVDALRRDRDRYQGLLAQAEVQISAWNERADSLQQAIGGLDQLLALAGTDGAADAGPARQLLPGRGVAPGAATVEPPAPRPVAPATKKKAPSAKRPAPKPVSPGPAPAPAPTPVPQSTAASAPDPDPAPAPAPSEPTADGELAYTTEDATSSGGVIAPDAPRGTDAVRIVLDADPDRSFTLAELITELDERHWLAPSRRPEELVRINLKRLAERGGAVRTEDGRWKASAHSSDDAPPAEPTPPPADPPPVVGSTIREW